MEASLDPTPAEIAERSAEIREAWSDRERAKRASRWARVAWLPPLWADVEDRNEPERGWN